MERSTFTLDLKIKTMRVLKFTVAIIWTFLLISCGGSITQQPANSIGFGEIEKEIKSKFGENAYFTDLTIAYDKSIGNIISTTTTRAPQSLKMGQWNLTHGSWNQNSEVSLEVPDGSQAKDFMFQLNEQINLSKLGDLVEKSVNQLKTEKKLNNPVLSMAFVKFPKNGDISKANYTVMLQPESGGSSISFYYALNGDLINMEY